MERSLSSHQVAGLHAIRISSDSEVINTIEINGDTPDITGFGYYTSTVTQASWSLDYNQP